MFFAGAFGAGLLFPLAPGTPAHTTFVAAGRVDNRTELAAELGFSRLTNPQEGDACLMRRAWNRWGEAAPAKIFGDWAFAAWSPAGRTLFLARDHFGNTALYYRATPLGFAFASSRRALLALEDRPAELDESVFARVLVSWMPRNDGATVHGRIKRLPPGHALTVTPRGFTLRQYWRLDAGPELHLPRRSDYVDGFLSLFQRAVSDRLDGEGPVASMLSGGLDSGSVTVTAAEILGKQGKRLAAFTSVPRFHETTYNPLCFGDELPFARATAETNSNIDLHAEDAAGLTPVSAVRDLLEMTLEPMHAAANAYWAIDLYRQAAQRGFRTLLTGQLGNGGVSWTGDTFSQPLVFQVRSLGVLGWLRQSLRRQLLGGPATRMLVRRGHEINIARSAILPDFARRIRLLDRWCDEPAHFSSASAHGRRYRMLEPNLAAVGSQYAEMGEATGLSMRDPTADARLLEFCVSVPDRIFIDPATGLDRWLIREAMKGRLPDEVRLNRRRGKQAADIVARLRASADEMEDALSEIARGRAAGYVDVARMRAAWTRVRTEDSREAAVLATTLLMRGVMAGLFVNGFGTKW